MNQSKTILLALAACLGTLLTSQAQTNITVLATFDYRGNSTTARGLNDLGEVTCTYVDPTGVTYSFLRSANGRFSRVQGFQFGDYYFARGVNNSLEFTGAIKTQTNFVGFIQTGNQTTSVGFCGGIGDTYFYGINNDGDAVGSAQCTGETTRFAALFINGVTSSFDLPNSYGDANGINLTDQIVGEYYDVAPATSFHGFLRSPLGKLTYPIDFPGAVSTTLLAINDKGLVTGQWVDNTGAEHGFVADLPDKFVSFDYPGATSTAGK